MTEREYSGVSHGNGISDREQEPDYYLNHGIAGLKDFTD
jgi:hypothetical protein